MLAIALKAIGLVLIVEGLAYALAPSLVEQVLENLRTLTLEQRRVIGLIVLALGIGVAWVAKSMGA